ncbi:MAG: NYN domain-containing protein [Candidatus Rokuibacteriota bacterium]
MRWLVDGYNVIRRDPDLRAAEAAGLEAGRAALLRAIAPVAQRSADRFTVVFDGAPSRAPAPPPGRLEVVFSRPPQKADDVLGRLAREAGAGTVVVSDDRAVADAARRAHCTVVGGESFLAALAGAASGAAQGARDDDEDDEDAGPGRERRRGNPRRLSRDDRAALRALRRLRNS